MIPRIKKFTPLKDFILKVAFDDGKIVLYDVKDDVKNIPSYAPLTETYRLFEHARLDSSRTVIFWNKEIDLPSDAIYMRGKEISENS